MDENEVRILAYCAECDDAITDEIENYYYDDDGNFFCCEECMMNYHGIHKLEV
jgi:hypothetical protein